MPTVALNRGKLRREARIYLEAFENAKANHAGGDYVNRHVEGARASPYLVGHATALRIPPHLFARLVCFFIRG